MSDVVTFALIGFVAQIIDGALGMAFGIIASSSLMASPSFSLTVGQARTSTGTSRSRTILRTTASCFCICSSRTFA